MRTINDKPVCPCCGVNEEKNSESVGDSGFVRRCTKCEAIYTAGGSHIYLGESYTLVKPHFTEDPEADDRSVYYDFMCLGSEGVTRRHGFFDPDTKLITQVG